MPEKPIKVLLLADRFQVRGSSLYTLRLARALRDHKVDVTILCPGIGEMEPQIRAQLPVREYEHLMTPLWGRVVREMVRKDLEKSPPDIIHVQSRSMLGLGTWLAKTFHRPFLLTLHDYLRDRERFSFDMSLGMRIIAVSQSVKQDLLARTILPEELITVVHTGVEVNCRIEREPVLDPGHVPVIGTASPLESLKGLPFFLGAARKVLDSRHEVEFLIAGAGPEEMNLRRLARKLNMTSNVTFVPNLHDFSLALAAMDVFCLPSLSQGLGTIMLEAMAMGKPVIATGVGGVFSVIREHETGLIVPPGDSTALARKIVELLAEPVRARAIGESGRQLVLQEFSTEQMGTRTLAVYQEVLETFRLLYPSRKESVMVDV